MGRLARALIEPIAADKLAAGVRANTAKALKAHKPLRAAPDYDHPLVKALVQQMPLLTYEGLKKVKKHLERHDEKSHTDARIVDGMLFLVDTELTKRDHDRARADASFIDLLTSKGLIKP